MELTKWKIRNEIYSFPKQWSKEEVLRYCNSNYIRVCEFCAKIDIGLDHFTDCNPSMQRLRNQRMQEYYD